MIPTDDVTLTVTDLPPRPQGLVPEELSDVFGGCQHIDEECHGDKECCLKMNCRKDYCRSYPG